MSFQIFLLVGHFANMTRDNLLTDSTLKLTQDVLVRCSVVMFQSYCEVHQTFSKFGWTMSDGQLLIPAPLVCVQGSLGLNHAPYSS